MPIRNLLGRLALEAVWNIDTGDALKLGSVWRNDGFVKLEDVPEKYIKTFEVLFKLYQKNLKQLNEILSPPNLNEQLKGLHHILSKNSMCLVDYYQPVQRSESPTRYYFPIYNHPKIKLIYILYTGTNRERLFHIPNGILLDLMTQLGQEYKLRIFPEDEGIDPKISEENLSLEDRCRTTYNAIIKLCTAPPENYEIRIVELRTFLLGRTALWGQNIGYLAYVLK
ncbi:MAG: hypothetical protein DRN95_03475 [Candidatus Hydrothermarchaeota archaeon]|nr:MAG: hypothetical protein DRN95_03475 [Candidatus Hydrothermarchaeota archaeon]